jgi:hypothetical protein
MKLTNSRFTISTMAVAACAMVALVAAESAHAQTATPAVQRIEIVGQRLAPVQQIVIVGKRQAAPEVQRVVIVGQRLRAEPANLAAVTSKPAAL